MRFFLCFALIFVNSLAYPQELDNYNKLVPTPDAASILKSYQISNSNYTGSAAIDIPVYSYPAWDGMNISVSLGYNGGNGLKADELPSWVGLGWNLNVGGIITRIAKNQPDEFLPLTTNTSILFGEVVITKSLASGDVAYLTNYNKLNRVDWFQTSFLNTLNTNSPYQSGTGTSSINTNANPLFDLEADEFSFTINGISGRFFLNHLGDWQVTTDAPGTFFTVEPVIRNSVIIGKKMPRAIVQFILQGSDGTKYYFGEDQTTHPKNIEYNYPGFWTRSSQSTGIWTEVMPSSWHITRIVNVLGEEINFKYKKMGYQSGKTRSYFGYTGSVPNAKYFAKTLVGSSYLEEITFGDNKITFQTAASVQLGTNENVESDGILFYDANSTISSDVMTAKNGYPKLTSIKIFHKENEVKSFSFTYIDNISERLKLEYFKETNIGAGEAAVYKFVYNNQKLPVYGSGKTDHWGYYNGTDYFQTATFPVPYSSLLNDYSASKETSSTLSKSEILEKIILPTKGIIEYVYEPRVYSKVASRWPFSISDANANLIAGGVRVQKIINKDNLENVLKETIYSYERPGSGITCGILTIPKPNYLGGTASSYSFRSEGFNNYNGRGALVVYPYVKETVTNNGYTNYQYEGFETSVIDAAPLNQLPISVHDAEYDQCFNNKRSFRAKLLKESVFNNNNILIKETEYKYAHELTPGANKIRNIHYIPAVRYGGSAGFSAAAYESDFYEDVLVKKIARQFSGGAEIQITSENIFDEYNNVIENITTTNNNEIIKSKTKFPFNLSYNNFGSDEKSLGIANLKALGIKNAPIETYKSKANVIPAGSNQRITFASLLSYYPTKPLLKESYQMETESPVPSANFTESIISGNSFQNDNRYKRKLLIHNYDNIGNVLSVQKEGDHNYVYLYGYNKKHVVAKIQNADFSTANALIDQSILDNPASDNILRNHLNLLRNIPGALISTFTYRPLVGMTSETDINGRIRYYEYDLFNRLVLVKDHDRNILKKICYNYAGQEENCDVPCPIDDLPIWQNTGNVRCQFNSSCGYTGYQEIEQANVNTCLTGVSNQWVLGPYNPTACATSPYTQVDVVNNSGTSGLYIKYTAVSSPYNEYIFPIPASSGPLGCVPGGKSKPYNIQVYHPGFPPLLTYTIGGTTVSGTPANFNGISIVPTTKTLTINYDF